MLSLIFAMNAQIFACAQKNFFKYICVRIVQRKNRLEKKLF